MMPPRFLLILLLISVHHLYSQPVATPYKEVDQFVKNFPLKPSAPGDIRVLAREFKRQFHSQDDLARAAFVWITNNISYDCEGYRQGQGFYELNDVLRQKKGICAGYASLMKFFCDELGVECIIISGFATGIGLKEIDSTSLESNHAWNAVRINDEWKLIDATWGSGYADEKCEKFTPVFKEYYFYCKAEEMIKSHFPDDIFKQFLAKPLTAKQFVDSIEFRKKADLAAAKEGEEPKDSVIKRNLGETVRFLFEKKDARNMVTISVYGKNGKSPIDIFDSIKVNESSYYYDYKIKKVGYYRVDVSLFYYTGVEAESVGTPAETYFLQVPANSKSSAPIKKN